MNLQSTVNAAVGSAGQSIAVAKLLGQDAKTGMDVQNDIDMTKDKLTDTDIKIAQMPKLTRNDQGRWLEAMDSLLEEKQALLDQKNNLIAYYQSLYKGVDGKGQVVFTDFRQRLIPKKVKAKTETVPTSEDIAEEKLHDRQEQRKAD